MVDLIFILMLAGLGKLGLQTKSHSMPIFINKVLLEHSSVHMLTNCQ